MPATAIDLDTLPGHHIRRLHQIAVAVFLQETEAHGITPADWPQALADLQVLEQRALEIWRDQRASRGG